MNESLLRGGLLIAGVIHLLPIAGIAGGSQLRELYGISALTDDLELLLRHRALLFALLGALLLSAIWVRHLRPAALIAGLISTIGFLGLAGAPSAVGPALARVWWADVLAIVALLVAVTGAWRERAHATQQLTKSGS